MDTKLIAHNKGRLLHQQRSANKNCQVREGGGLRWLHFDHHDIQAVIDLSQPDQLTTPYSFGMLSALLYQPEPNTCLNLGLGGASFERFFARRLPRLRITSVEADPVVIRLARSFFMLPPHHPVILDDAARFLSRHQGSYDLIFCDIHQGTEHPDCLTDANFHADIFRCLNSSGVYVINLLHDGFPHLQRVLMRLRDSFPQVQVLDIPERKNLVIFATKQPPPGASVLAQRASSLATQLQIDPDLLRQPKTTLPQRPTERRPKP